MFRFSRSCSLPLTLFPLMFAATSCQHAAPPSLKGLLAPAGLRCEYAKEPIAVDTASPRLSWTLATASDSEFGKSQTAYRIIASSTMEKLQADIGDLWDTRRVASPRTTQIAYEGKPLESRQRVYWKVRAWDERDKPSPWSEPASWEMGLMNPADWTATWISSPDPLPTNDEDFFRPAPAPLLRREFRIDKPVKSARAHVSGLGYHELRLNGEKVGDHVLDPAWTDFSKRVYYSTFDVTHQLAQGDNAVGIMLGNGWYNPLPMRMWGRYNLREHLPVGRPRAILQLEIEHTDGTRMTIATDETWKVSPGPIVRNGVYLGEEYDARLELPGWDTRDYNDSAWPAVVRANEPLGPLQALNMPPIKRSETIRPLAVTEPQTGTYIFDMGRNFSGVATLRVEGPAGTRVSMRYGELLYPDGTLNGMTSVCGQIKGVAVAEGSDMPSTAWQQDTYTLKGQGLEEYTPRFTFHGFRYVEVTGLPSKPSLDTVEGVVLNTAVESAGAFECSNEMFNQIQLATRRTILSNLFSVQSDCPHREKFGYGGDIVACSEAVMFNFDMASFYAKAVNDFADAVRPNGAFTETAPFVGIDIPGLGDQAGPIGWGTVHPMLQAQLRQYYGEERLIAQERERTADWIALLQSKSTDGILVNGIGDHESIAPKPELTGTAFYAYNVDLARQLAIVRGEKDKAADYAKLRDEIRKAFNEKYLLPGTGRYESATQAAQAFALYMDLVPETECEGAMAALVHDIVEVEGSHLTTGIFGTKYLLEVLSSMGHHDLAYAIVNQKTFPGWGFMLENSATTLWEHWAFSDNTFSHNHPMFGSVSEWFFKYVAGIRPCPDAVGFDKVIVQPGPITGELTWAKAEYMTPQGPVKTDWRIEDGTLNLKVTIPIGLTATVLPPLDRAPVPWRMVGSPPAGARSLGKEPDDVEFQVGSGTYEFRFRRLESVSSR